MKKNIAAKVFAWLALLGIVTSIIGTGILYFYESSMNQPIPTFEDYLRNNPLQIDPSFQIDTNEEENFEEGENEFLENINE